MNYLKKLISLVLALAVILSCTSASSPSQKISKSYYIQVLLDNVSVRTGPGVGYDLIGHAKAGSKFDYIGANFDAVDILWYKISDKNGTTGWVSSNYSRRYPFTKTKNTAPKYTSDGTREGDVGEAIYGIGKEKNAVGIQAALIRGSDGKIFNWTYGWAKKNETPMTKKTKIRSASISKVITAVCALKMQEEGIVDISRRIDKYWGKKLAKGISLGTLFTHTSTLGYLSVQTSKSGYLNQLTREGNYFPYDAGSSSGWIYNNYAISVAAATLELAYGGSLNDYAKEKLFGPIGVDMSFFTGDLQNTDELATLYEYDGSVELSQNEAKHLLPKNEGTVRDAGAYVGGATGSARDIAKIFYMLANNGMFGNERILSKESVESLEEKFFKVNEHGGTFSQCLALRYQDDICGTSGLYYHTGNAYGVIALASYDPKTKNTVVVLTTGADQSRDENGIYSVCTEISELIYTNAGKL